MLFLVELVNTAIMIYTYALLARIILSWVPHDPRGNPIIFWLYRVTEPVLAPARRIIPPMGMVDVSPIAVFILLEVVRRLLVALLMGLVY